jgi:hypothetical protein
MNWDSVLQEFKSQVTDFATHEFNEYKDALISDSAIFIEGTKTKVVEWTNLLAAGKMDQDEFKSLIKGLEDSLKLEALKKAGQAQIKAYEIKEGITNILISSVLKNI